jgi:calcineurin-like phosphoesterase family protein
MRFRTPISTRAAWLAVLVGVGVVVLLGGRVVTSQAASDPVIAAAGDIACDPANSNFNGGNGTSGACNETATSNLVLSDPTISAVLALGDNQYECGALTAYQQSFAPSWGRFLAMIHPVPGNHEYQTSGGSGCDTTGHAGGYFTYFGAGATGNAQGDYAWDIGAWHMIALNGNCGKVGGCGAGSAQATFLQQNLGSATCTLAYWHQPYYNGSTTASSYQFFWQTLYNAGADLVLNGHQHSYARFAPQNASGNVDTATGIRQFIVGTGGDSLFSLPGTKNVQFSAKKYGVLRLTLHPASYDWQFVAKDGTTLDSGTNSCH